MEKLGYILLADDNENDLGQRALVQYCIANEIVVVHDGAEALDFLNVAGNLATAIQPTPGCIARYQNAQG